MNETIKTLFVKEIESRCEKATYAIDRETHTLNYYGATVLLLFANVELGIINDEEYNMLSKKIDESNRTFYDNLHNDLESVHRRLF